MLNLENIIRNESVEDIILFFSSRSNGIGYITMDGLFVRFRRSVIAEGELLMTSHRMLREKMIESRGHSMVYFKGPNWKEPAFMTEKKYGIE
jgi:hypothetical protein